MSKFSAGDRVVYLSSNIRGVVLTVGKTSDEVKVGFDVNGPGEVFRGSFDEKHLEFEHVYDSPLYEALS